MGPITNWYSVVPLTFHVADGIFPQILPQVKVDEASHARDVIFLVVKGAKKFSPANILLLQYVFLYI